MAILDFVLSHKYLLWISQNITTHTHETIQFKDSAWNFSVGPTEIVSSFPCSCNLQSNTLYADKHLLPNTTSVGNLILQGFGCGSPHCFSWLWKIYFAPYPGSVLVQQFWITPTVPAFSEIVSERTLCNQSILVCGFPAIVSPSAECFAMYNNYVLSFLFFGLSRIFKNC